MKHKLKEDDIPTPVIKTDSSSDTGQTPSFESLGLDTRLLQAIVREGLSKPTPIQAQIIPLALDGKDIAARAKTGSGKTLAYVLPVLESILRKKINKNQTAVAALILVPTKELAEQVSKVLASYCAYCTKEVKLLNLAQNTSDAVQRSLLTDLPDVLVATPARVRTHLDSSALDIKNLSCLVVDEADLVLSYGYEEDILSIAEALPGHVQALLMSATLTVEIDTLSGLFCKNPVILALDESGEEENPISQFVVKCAEDEKFLLLYVIVKFKLIKGKCIIFVGDIDRCYRLKLYLEQFGVRSCVLNSELPVNSRIHVVEEFNKSVYDIIIAADVHEVLGPEDSRKKISTNEDGGIEEVGGDDRKKQNSVKVSEPPKKKQMRKVKKDREYGISRGIDFKNVACVLNFDLPTSSGSYTHRIGRTGRAGKTGMALSFVVPRNVYRKHKPTSFPTAEHDEDVLADILKHQSQKGQEVKDYHFDMKQVNAFRYRTNDALRAVTGVAIREARTRELRQELIKSDKLKRHFEENPRDLHHLRHDGELHAARVQEHLKHVPDYLMPNGGKQAITGRDIGFVALQKTDEKKSRKGNRYRGRGRKPGSRRANPLKTFSMKRSR